jgi:hypothetical protein
MPVVINEFEVLPEAQPETRKATPDQASEGRPPQKLESCLLAAALRGLEIRNLRVWAH